ncbi:MAG: galactose-1-phosphate uridylyltransferase [Methanomicrobiaceae archaeon]|nr:galactose-1-phosphate uridylyltransferase [Methanomicrobiaceae archaeon]
MFSEEKIILKDIIIHRRCESLTGFKCRISPTRLKRGIDPFSVLNPASGVCNFCPERVYADTPVFENKSRITIGESVTFPNLYPFAKVHVVTVITKEHSPEYYTKKQISDALKGQYEALKDKEGYPSINWNNQPSAGASMIHPHIQGICDDFPTYATGVYIRKSSQYLTDRDENYWDKLRENEKNSERYLFGDEIFWSANPVPFGEKEIRGYLPISSLSEFSSYIDDFSSGLVKVIGYYKELGHYAFNMALRFDKNNSDGSFKAFASVIARINPNPLSTSDSAFMERLHLEPVVLTIPEDIGENYRKMN